VEILVKIVLFMIFFVRKISDFFMEGLGLVVFHVGLD